MPDKNLLQGKQHILFLFTWRKSCKTTELMIKKISMQEYNTSHLPAQRSASFSLCNAATHGRRFVLKINTKYFAHHKVTHQLLTDDDYHSNKVRDSHNDNTS